MKCDGAFVPTLHAHVIQTSSVIVKVLHFQINPFDMDNEFPRTLEVQKLTHLRILKPQITNFRSTMNVASYQVQKESNRTLHSRCQPTLLYF